MTFSSLSLGPLRVDRVTRAEALDVIASMVATRQGGYVVTPNVDHIVLAQRNEQLRRDYAGAGLSLADGQPLLWMARLLGQPLPARISGADLVRPLAARAAHAGWRVFLVGATPEVSATAAERLRKSFPGLQIVGRDTSLWSMDDPVLAAASPVAAAIRASRADLVVVALGCPKQERWMAHHAAAIQPAVAIGLGGSLDFVAGKVKRAPSWMSRAGLEWTYRLAQEPRRMAYRYLVRDPQIVPIFARLWWRRLTAAPVLGFSEGDA